jgi:hypothetical protein
MTSSTVPTLLLAGAFIAFLPAPASARDVIERFDFDLTGGSRVDQLDWNIAGDFDGNNPNILSELTWKDLKSDQVSARAKMIMANKRVSFRGMVRGSFDYGDLKSGTNQDSDYFGDNRTNEFSRSNNRADRGDVWDASLGGGVVFYFDQARTFSLAPVAGISYHEQNLTLHDGYQTLNEPAYTPSGVEVPPVGPVFGLDSKYNSQWRSGWLGVDVDYNPIPYFNLRATGEFHAGKYEAEADWNLRRDLDHPRSFRHTSDNATGVVAGVGMRAGLPNLFLTVDYRYQKWQADDGQDRTYYSDGTVWVTKFNEVNWEASSINGGVTVRF